MQFIHDLTGVTDSAILSTVALLLLSIALAFFIRISFRISPNVIPDFSLIYFDR